MGQQFEATTRRLINTTLTETLFPGKFFGVSRRQAEQPGYLGNLITKELQFQKRLTPLFNNLLGKRFGGQYASLFSQAGGLLLDRGVNALGGMLGFDANSPFGFGQIVGNLMTKGKQGKEARKLGIEQLVYSMTGIPIGAQSGLSFLQKTFPSLFGGATGYMTPQQQMMGLTNSAMGFLQPGMMFGQTLAGGMNMISGPAAQMQMAMLNRATTVDGLKMTQNDANVLKVQEGFTYDSFETATNQQQGFFNQLGTGLSNVFNSVGGGLANVMGSLMGGGGLGGILNWGFNLLASLFSGMGGGSGGGMFGGGGFFEDLGKAWSGEMSWGDALLNTGMKVGGNLVTNYAAYALTKNIKNPYVKLAAQQGANYLIKSGLQFGAGALGYGDVASKFLGKDTGLTTALKTGDFSSLNPFKTGGSSGYGPGEVGLAGPGTNITMPASTGISTPYNDFGTTTATTDLTGYIEPGTTLS